MASTSNDWICICGKRRDADDVFCGFCGERRGTRAHPGEWGCSCGRLCTPVEQSCDACGRARRPGFASKRERDAFLKSAERRDASLLRAIDQHFAAECALFYEDIYEHIPLYDRDEEPSVAPPDRDYGEG